MSEGIVKSIIGEGAYLVELVKDIDVADQIARLDGLISKYQDKIDEAGPNTAIYQLRQKEAQTKKAYFEAIRDEAPTEETCWLADYPDGDPISVGDHVGIIDLDREYSEHKNIYPAFAGEHVYTPARDGAMKPVELMNPSWAYWNAAVGPGLQKWHPRYRHGEIYDLDKTANTCSVSLKELIGYAMADDTQIMYLNDVDNLVGVPVDYMDCHAEAFEDGNIALIKFENNNYGEAKVIGFKDNPQPCDEEELVRVQFGELGFVWDLKTNTYHEDLTGTRPIAQVDSFLAGKTETTIDDDGKGEAYNYRGLPYERLLWCYYADAGYEIFRDKATTWGLDEHGGEPGYLWDEPELSSTKTEEADTPSAGFTTIRAVSVYGPQESPWGTFGPGFTSDVTTVYITGSWQVWHAEGTGFDYFNSWDFFESAYICPLDAPSMPEALDYYGYGTDAEYGNDPIGLTYPGCAMSEKSCVQVLFSSHVFHTFVEDYGTPKVKTYTGVRETIAHCTASAIPWDETLETNPQLQPRNDDLSTAMVGLIEGYYDLIGYGPTDIISYRGLPLVEVDGPCGVDMKISADGVYAYHVPGVVPCEAECNRTWKEILSPVFNVKIYGR